jgi:hypothetical protein
MKNLFAFVLLVGFISFLNPVDAQLIIRGDSTGSTGVRSIEVLRLNTGKGAQVTVVTRTGAKLKCVIPHLGPTECFQNPDTSLIIMKSNTEFDIKPFYQDGNMILLPLLGYEQMHYIYALRITGNTLKSLHQSDQVYWSIMSRWHFPYVIYDPKRDQIIDFNRRSWNDFKNLTAGIYKLGKTANFRGEIYLQDNKDLDLQIISKDINKFYVDFVALYNKRSTGKLRQADGTKITKDSDKGIKKLDISNRIYH